MTRMIIEEIDTIEDDEEFTDAVLTLNFHIEDEAVQEGNTILTDINFTTGRLILSTGRSLPVRFPKGER